MPRKRNSNTQNKRASLEEGNNVRNFARNKLYCPVKEVSHLMRYNIITFVYYSLFIIYLIGTENYLDLGDIKYAILAVFHIIIEIMKYMLVQTKSKNVLMKSESYVCKTFITFAYTMVICYIFTILFGQEVFTNVTKTFVYSCILAALLQAPQYLYTKTNFILHIFGTRSVPDHLISRAMLGISYSTLCGTWLGGFVIPLDWDRPWQNWPIPCVIGALVGYTAGQLYSFCLYYNYTY